MAGDATGFQLGRRFGRNFAVKHGPRVRLTEERLQRVEAYFARHGGKTIIFGRWVGFVRPLMPFTAGTSGLPYRRFLPYDVLSAGAWSTTFCLLGFIEFKTLDELFSYIDGEAGRWSFPDAAARQAYGDRLLRRGVESRLVSMTYERPLELLLTHTREELAEAVAGRFAGTAPVFTGRSWRLDASVYRQALLDVQQRWKTSLNCWSAALPCSTGSCPPSKTHSSAVPSLK